MCGHFKCSRTTLPRATVRCTPLLHSWRTSQFVPGFSLVTGHCLTRKKENEAIKKKEVIPRKKSERD
jgi:hypothetical protein